LRPLLSTTTTTLRLSPCALQARTGALVNLRDAFCAKDSAIADEVTGKVETKYLDKKVAAVEEQVAKIARTELNGALPPQLARISKTTALARTSMTGANLGRTSATAIQQQVQEIEVSAAGGLFFSVGGVGGGGGITACCCGCLGEKGLMASKPMHASPADLPAR
jgi:hypothetical protein